jgi:integrase
MSVHRDGKGWKVRWREAGKNRSRKFDRKGDADLFDANLRRAKQLGPALVKEITAPRASVTLDGFVSAGFRAHAATLAPKTREQYRWAMRNHLAELQDTALADFDVPMLVAHQGFLLGNGRSEHTARTVMTMLSGILQIAVEHGVIPSNPARAMRKVKVERKDEIRALTPAELLRLMDAFTGRERAIVVLGGLLGLRPLEIRMVRWDDLTDDAVTIGRARTKKTAARTRTVTVPKLARDELRRWRMESGRPAGDAPIIGGVSADNLKAIGFRKITPTAAKALGRDDVTIYTLRHSHASALHYCGWTVPAAARRLGHGPALHVSRYAHVINALEGRSRYADLDALYAAARAEISAGVPATFPEAGKK